ncbi:tetratricopeptide repeat protein 25-like [Nylanderia fulva]|uniref:tetratricopeptide repeat protein 25-like n=1 Tax=Nylanderia fulva TaxID=613905 RepID=UPI0010FB1239|nr:tetratricopeptide repeat protein 25-like [Nylanderia fulva]
MATSGRWELNTCDLDVTKRTVENAESRARLQIKPSVSKLSRENNRQYAQALHRQADDLYQRGEYESALVLYHRAATVCPHDSSHSVAARRTAATINSWNNPEKSLVGLSVSTRHDAISKVTSVSNRSTLKARDVSKYLDTSKKLSRKASCAPGSLTSQLTRSRMILKHINNRASAMLKALEANFNAGKIKTSLRFAEDLLTFSSGLEDPRRYAIPAYRYLSLIHVALGRHDRACSNVAKLVRLSKGSKNIVLLSEALVTLGKVHLSFGHLGAAARAWENLSIHIDHPVPRAWLHHEIGRCHLETGKYAEALRKASQCRECAMEASSNKWTFHAGLLRAQCLATLGRFAGDDSISQPVAPKALEELRIATKICEEVGDTPTLSYIRDLIEQLTRALRQVTFGEDQCLKGAPRRLSPRSNETGLSEGNRAIKTWGIRRMSDSDDALIPSFYSDCLDGEILDRHQIDDESGSLGSARSFRSKRTNLTYVIESQTDVSSQGKLDGIYNDELGELLSRESHTTFRTCYIESGHFIDKEKTPSLRQSIETCSSNVGTSGERVGCKTFRVTKSCDDGRCNL